MRSQYRTAMDGRAIGARAKTLRLSLHETQGQVAQYAGLDRTWLSALEVGKIPNPGAQRLERLAEHYGVTVRFLTTGTQETDEPEKDAIIGRMRRWPTNVLRRVEESAKAWIVDGLAQNAEDIDQIAAEHVGLDPPRRGRPRLRPDEKEPSQK